MFWGLLNTDLAVEDVVLGVVVGAVQHLVAHAALETTSVPLLTSGWKYFRKYFKAFYFINERERDQKAFYYSAEEIRRSRSVLKVKVTHDRHYTMRYDCLHYMEVTPK